MEQRRYVKRERYYTEGNTVRKEYVNTYTSPRKQVREDERPVERPHGVPKKRARERVDIKSIASIAISATLVVVLSLGFLTYQAESTANNEKIIALESEINKIATDNNIREIEINSNIDYDMIYTKATILGMQSADKNQIVPYDRGTLEYVKQYEDVPTNK